MTDKALSPTFAYIGNWDRWKKPIKDAFVICSLDAGSGALTPIASQHPGISVGQTAVDARRGILYCTDETSHNPDYFAGGGGRIFAFAIDAATGTLTELNHLSSFGSLPSYIALLPESDLLVVTHHTDTPPVTRVGRTDRGEFELQLTYDDATTVLFPLNPDGSIGKPLDVHTWHGGGGPLPRQTHPRLHSIAVAPSGRFFLVCDKGNDQVLTFHIEDQRKLVVASVHGARSGSSPRYSAFHPTLPVVYVNHETQPVIEVLAFDDEGVLRSLAHVDSLAPPLMGATASAQSDIRVSQDGRFLYQLIRGVDLISVFAIDGVTGGLTRVQTTPTRGRDPRGCALSPDGRFLYVASRLSDAVEVWDISASGTVTSRSDHVQAPAAGSITIVAPHH